MRNKQWQKHHRRDQTTANRMTVFLFFLRSRNRGMATGIYQGNLRFKQSGKIPVPIPRFVKKNTFIWFAVVWAFLWCFCHCFFLVGNFVMVDSPLFPKSPGIGKKMAGSTTRYTFSTLTSPTKNKRSPKKTISANIVPSIPSAHLKSKIKYNTSPKNPNSAKIVPSIPLARLKPTKKQSPKNAKLSKTYPKISAVKHKPSQNQSA